MFVSGPTKKGREFSFPIIAMEIVIGHGNMSQTKQSRRLG
jgi:hypothetical protein